MNERFKAAYRALPLNEKRNQLSNELIAIGEYLKYINDGLHLKSDLKVKNYHMQKDRELTENEYLSFIYEDVYNISKDIMTILKAQETRNRRGTGGFY